LLGAILGRTKEWSELRMSSWRAITVSAAAGVGLTIGAVTLAHPSSANFDVRIRSTATMEQRRAEVIRAQAAHPFDYYYVLLEASTQPLVRAGDPHSPRLRVLNRALLLCPRCPEVHTEVARALWLLGKRRQALAEWQFAMAARPTLFSPTTEEVWKAGARPEEMAVLGAGDPSVLIQIATLLVRKSDREGARKVLNSIPMGQVVSNNVLLLRADLDLGDGQIERALQTLNRLDELTPNEPRAYLLRADLALRAQGVDAVNAALNVLDKGIAANPYDIPLQDRRVRLIMGNEKWSRAQPALEGLETALFHAGENTAFVHASRAQVAAHLGDSKTAVAEYRAAINQSAGDVRSWMELARYYESLGRYDDAAATWTEALHQQPNDGGIAANVARLRERKAGLEAAARSQLFLGR
jgi:tetratricopeptide (TPR) repeat protein